MESITTLSILLPSSYKVAFVVPFLVLSLLSTFAGAFLTLDRTRTFRPLGDTGGNETKRLKWRYEGGVGGTIIGVLCGVHLSTYFGLLIANRTSSKLGEVQYLVIWLICGSVLAILGSRWRIAVSVFAGLLGGFAISVLLCMMFHPGLEARLAIMAVFVSLALLGCLLPFALSQRWCTRISTTAIGSLGIIVSIALYKDSEQWTNPWLLMALSPWVGVRGPLEKGLTASCCLLLLAGVGVDYALHLKVGENPDKRWDAYLAEYSRNLPHSSDRAGVFQPFASMWDRLLKKPANQRPTRSAVGNKSEILLPPESQFIEKTELSSPPPAPPYRLVPGRKTSFLTKPKAPLNPPTYGDSDSSDDDNDKGPPKFRPWVAKRNSTSASSTPTLYGLDGSENEKIPKLLSPGPKRGVIYSDEEEEDVTTAASTPLKRSDTTSSRDSPGWKPAFILKHEQEKERLSMKSSSSILQEGRPRSDSPVPLSNSAHSSDRQSGTPGTVPITPSLIRAVDRINMAQRTVYGTPGSISSRPSPKSAKSGGMTLDADFWNEVRAKAAEVTTPNPSK